MRRRGTSRRRKGLGIRFLRRRGTRGTGHNGYRRMRGRRFRQSNPFFILLFSIIRFAGVSTLENTNIDNIRRAESCTR